MLKCRAGFFILFLLLAILSITNWLLFVIKNEVSVFIPYISVQSICLVITFIMLFWVKKKVALRFYCMIEWLFCLNILFFLFESWNVWFCYYYELKIYPEKEIFRESFYRSWAPFYAAYHWYYPVNQRLVILSFTFLPVWLAYISAHKTMSIPKYIGIAFFLFVLSFFLFGLSDGLSNRILSLSGHYKSFSFEIPFFTSVLDLLRHYVDMMGEMDIHNNHYPPGNLLLLKILSAFPYPGAVVRGLAVVMILLTIHPFVLLAEHFHVSSSTIRFSLFLFLFSHSFLSFPSFSMEIFTVPMFLYGLVFLFYSFNNPHYAYAWGFMIALFTFFSFGSTNLVMISLGVMILNFLRHNYPVQKMVSIVMYGLIAFAGIYVLLYLLTDFNIVECFFRAVANNQKQMTAQPYDTWARYLLRSTGNIIPFLLSPGLFTAGFVMRYFTGRKIFFPRTNGEILFASAGLSLLLFAFSGLYFMETERIWISYVPLLSLIAAIEVERCFLSQRQKGLLFTLSYLAVIILETYLDFCGGCFEY